MLPNWLQQLAAECPAEDRRQLENTLHKNQVEIDRRYRQRMAQQGIVRKTVLVPESRWKELQAMLRKWRQEALLEGE